MKKLIVCAIALAMVCMFVAPPAGADTTQVLNITVSSYATASILLNETTWNTNAPLDGGNDTKPFNLANDGAVSVSVDIKGAIEPTWTLNATADHDKLDLEYNITTDVDVTTSLLDFTNNLAWDEDVDFNMTIKMPTSSSISTQVYINVTFEATAD